MKRSDPKMQNDHLSGMQYGRCRECGKKKSLRNADGLVRMHRNMSTKALCKGSGMTPSKSAECVEIVGWTPPRRSN
jgi:hypothetical protein